MEPAGKVKQVALTEMRCFIRQETLGSADNTEDRQYSWSETEDCCVCRGRDEEMRSEASQVQTRKSVRE